MGVLRERVGLQKSAGSFAGKTREDEDEQRLNAEDERSETASKSRSGREGRWTMRLREDMVDE
jgi:hypothetical protein